MNKQELISKIAEKANLTKKDAANALAAVTSTITDALKEEGKLVKTGMGLVDK